MSKIEGEETPEEGPLAFDTVYHGDSLAACQPWSNRKALT